MTPAEQIKLLREAVSYALEAVKKYHEHPMTSAEVVLRKALAATESAPTGDELICRLCAMQGKKYCECEPAPVASGQDADWEVQQFLRESEVKAKLFEDTWGKDSATAKSYRRAISIIDRLRNVAPQDEAAESFSQAFYLITGMSPKFGVDFGYAEALAEIDDAQKTLRASIKGLRKKMREDAAPVPHDAVVPTDAELHALIKIEWKKIKPSLEAQQIRSGICVSFDGPYPEWAAHYMPEYVSDLLDIAAQKGINETALSVVADLARECADNLANMICGNGWLNFSDLMRGAMADEIAKYLKTATEKDKI